MNEEKETPSQKKSCKPKAVGRGITDYIADYNQQAYHYCLLGATNETLTQFFGVSDTTLKKWMKPVRKGKLMADMQVARSLYKRALGYTFQQIISELKVCPFR